MNKFSFLSNDKIHKIWAENRWESKEELYQFQQQLVLRGFISWDEINTKFICEEIK
jgi:hypothetical protein